MSLTPLSPDDLAWACDGGDCDGGDASAGNLIGQERAIEAMQLGLELYGPGYNIFVSGLTGTRRGQGVKALIEEIRAVCRPVPDRLFVHNFDEPHRPKLVTLPRGLGGKLVADVDRFCRGLRATLPEAFGSATFNDRHKAIQKQYVSRQQLALHDVMEASDKAGLTLVRLGDEEHSEPDIYPAVDGKPVPMEALEVLVREGHLTGDQVEQLGLDRDRLLTKLHEARATSRQLALEMRGRLEDLERETAERVVEPLVNDLRGAWAQPELRSHFDAVQEFAIDNAEPLIAFFDGMARTRLERRPRPFDIYLMPRGESSVQDDGAEECPVLFEANPTLENLFGTILPPGEDGPRLSHLEAGALLRADGGYLLVRLADVVQRPEVWPMLKSVLKTGILEIRPVESGRGPVSPLRPDPIEIQPKVVVIGEPGTYELLCREDPEFRKVFKVHAQFDTTMPNDAKNRAKYGAFVRGLVQSEGVHPSSGTGVGRLAEVGARLAGSRQRLSTRFGDLADLYREASHLAETGGRKLVERDDLLTAEQQRDGRVSLIVDKYLEGVSDGRYLMDLSGSVIGQVNGLVVLDTGALVWGRPSRITAQVGVGQEGVIDIERESELSGPIHEKGVHILEGYLLGTFAATTPLRLSATICFEQSYSGVDGDSASSTELYAILSALSEVPLAQGIAVTGSVDQRGRVQAVGGINEKLEGWFRVCQEAGLTGEQGAVIPRSNVDDLMLRPDVVVAARAGQFRIWAIESITEGLEILTGMPAGTIDAGDTTVLGRAAERLRQFAVAWREFR